MHKRLMGMGQPKYQQTFLGHVQFWPDELSKPYGWRKPRTVFLNSMSDIFHKNIRVRDIARIYAMMFLTQWHTYIVLTKRGDRACIVLRSQEFWDFFVDEVNNSPDSHRSPYGTMVYTPEDLKERWPLKNVWQGVSVESQEQDHRIDELGNTPAYIRVVSYEPAVGPLDLRKWFGLYEYETGKFGLKVGARWQGSPDWVIAGGESGHHAVPAHPDWFRIVRDQCEAAGVPFFFKQWGAWEPDSHVSFNGPFFIHGPKHYLVNIDGKYYPYGDILTDTPKYTEEENKLSEECNLTKEDNAYWMANTGKAKSGNFLDGKQHLNYPA